MNLGMPAGKTRAVRFYLVRHGCTKLNAHADVSADRIRGWLDVPLSPEGRSDAKKIAAGLKNSIVDKIYSSDLKRALDTAGALSKELDLDVKPTRVLRPWNLGDFAGEKAADMKADLHKFAFETPTVAVPNGESFDIFKARCLGGVIKLLQVNEGATCALFTHHRVERLLKAWIEKGQPKNYTIDQKIFEQKGEPPGSFEIVALRVPTEE